MKLPKIDLSSLPDMETLSGVFGTNSTPGHDDTVIVIATIVYETTSNTGSLL